MLQMIDLYWKVILLKGPIPKGQISSVNGLEVATQADVTSEDESSS